MLFEKWGSELAAVQLILQHALRVVFTDKQFGAACFFCDYFCLQVLERRTFTGCGDAVENDAFHGF
jgi:hypothetical protein